MTVYSHAAFEAPVPPTGSAEPGQGGFSEFFRYHGFWAPGVRLFRAIGFKLKAAIIALTFLLPIVALAWAYFGSKADQIAFSSKEHLGVVYAREVNGLLPLLQRDRLIAAQPPGVAGRDDVAQAISEHMALLAKVEAAHGATLGTAKAYGAFLAAHDAATRARGDAKTLAIRQTEAIGALLVLLDASTDGSNLTLDPDIDTYYLMDASMVRLPAMAEAVSQLQSQDGAAPARGSVPPDRIRKLFGGLFELSGDTQALDVDLAKAIAYNPQVAASVDSTAAGKAVRELTGLLDRSLQGAADTAGAANTPNTGRVEAGSRALDAIQALDAAAVDRLDALLAVRVGTLTKQRNTMIVVLAGSMLAALYLFIAFGRVLGGGMREIAFHVDAMREGDLTTRPRAWGADEPAQLMLTLSEMQQAQRRMVGQMRVASDAILGASSEIASGTGDLSRRTEMSAANLEETAASMEEIAATVKGNEQAVGEATKLALANARTTEQGGEVIGRVVHTMESISEASGRIGDIVGSIDAIAFQTNILALNAAVEAARAAEHGRGFAVVASEVRALAQSAAAAAREIKGLIATNLEQVDAGVQVVRQAGQTIGELVGGAKRISELLDEVAAGARELSIGVNQTASAVQQLDGVTQENAALVSEAAASVVELKGQAQRLASEVARFRLTSDDAARRAG